jgi:cellulose synthase/poly-beta-1,6-N-acetylglucosamine synthase-like glycosyltransferase
MCSFGDSIAPVLRIAIASDEPDRDRIRCGLASDRLRCHRRVRASGGSQSAVRRVVVGATVALTGHLDLGQLDGDGLVRLTDDRTLGHVGGYDEDMLTEDFAFAYTCYKERLDVRECLSYPSRIEAAHDPIDWWGQRKRWMTGYAQVMHELLVDVRPLREYRNVVSVILCAATTGGSLLLLTFLSKFAVLLVTGHELLFAVPLLTAVGVTVTVAVVDRQRGLIDRISPSFVLVPLIIPFYSLAALKATTEYLLSWEGEWYHVDKGSRQ